jgi:lambda family phage minor tail protein L
MAYTVTATYATEAAKLRGSYPVDMYVLNASLSGWEPLYYVNLNQDVYGYSMSSAGVLQAAEVVYTGLPIERGDVSTNTQGEIGEISISLPNTDRVIESIVQSRKYLRGRDVYFLSCFARHLPVGVTSKHIGVAEDKNSVLKEKMGIDSVTSNEKAITFNCKSKFNIKNVVLPRRTYYKECTWVYMGKYAATECNPQSTVNTASYPTCDGSLDNCRQRKNSARFGGFPSVPRKGFIIV